ncbi:MAG: hypothetical protein Ta2D_08600 [Rickettsiales bacterium]|nr:MAG: hypothetical protein Ta2D_08600 [Rickettsiales bacterium]
MYYILYQIKRFLCICFDAIKQIHLPKTKKQVKQITSKNIKYEREFEISSINFDEKWLLEKKLIPIYTTSPLFYLIKQNKIEIFNNLVKICNCYDFTIKIGVEIEFYTDNINKNDFDGLNIENIIDEMGAGQKEIQTKPYTDLQLLVSEYNKIKEILKDADFNAIANENDCSSALQINLSLEKEGNNLFAREEEQENSLLLNCVAGLLKNINNNLLLYIDNENCLKRFDLDRNKKVVAEKKYPAPTFVSWGINNRSCAIRIPTPKDFKNYVEIDKKERRIEFRVPSSAADIYLVLIGVLSAIIEGIDDNLMPHIEKTSFNVLEKNDKLEKIGDNINEFKINKNVLFY